jgi:plastocyanin
MKIATLISIAGSAGMCVAACASEYMVGQKGRTFSAANLDIKRGDVVVFVNDDNITHNVSSSSAGNEFNLGSQALGTSTSVIFTTAGEVDVRCLIHPRMRLTVKITE